MASFWNALTGKKSSNSSNANEAPADSGDTAPTTSFTSQPFDPSAVADVSSFLNPATFDATALHPLAGLDQGLAYLELDDAALSTLPGGQSALPSRGWSDDLCYGTGTTYLVALSLGGAWGLAEGLKKSPPNAPPRLKLNAVLNSVTRRGPFLGNSAAVVAMLYNGVNSAVGHVRGKHDVTNSILSGFISGAIFKSTRGIRPMLISGGLVGTAAGIWSIGSKAVMARQY
ncbi:Mitochondrial import inner membrane translocase subunit tim23 [Rhizina undulata]